MINEVLASPGDGQAGFVELFNPGPDTVEVGNWIVAPSFGSRNQGFAIPTGVPIEAGGYLSIAQEHLPFALSPAGGTVVVLATNEFGGPLGTFQEFAYGAAEPGVSYGTYAAGGEEFVVPLSEPTPGAANALPLAAEIAINEIMYQPAPGGGDEYVEIVNASAETQPLAGWRLSGAGFDFPADASLFPGQLALVVPVDPSAFRAANAIPDAVPIFGPYPGALDNGGERLALERPVETSAGPALRPEDEVRYGDAAPWPAEADGQGASLERISPAHFAGDPASWRASNPEAEPSPGLLPHLSYAQWAAPIFADFDGLIDLPHLDPDLDGIANLGEYLLGLHPLHPDPPPAQIAADPAPVLHFTRIPNRDGEAAAESSADLIGWGRADPAEPPLNNGDGSETVIVPFPGGTAFGRLRFTSGAAVP
ncbi:MAG: lamin tail domain-containing protein [Verrucomicrobiales bacterium]